MKHRLFLFCSLIPAFCFGASFPARLYLADARLSLEIPAGWTTADSHALDPLFLRETPEGGQALIGVRFSNVADETKFSTSVDVETLKAFALADAGAQKGGGRVLTQEARLLAERPAYEITWETPQGDKLEQTQALYLYVDNRYVILYLRAARESFPWLVPEFQKWLTGAGSLSRRGSGSLDTPSHGGIWINVAGGARIRVPEDWLIGVADDRMMGAAFAEQDRHVMFTATVDAVSTSAQAQLDAGLETAKAQIQQKGFRVTETAQEPFHGLPALELSYEGAPKGRFFKGHDIWVFSPKGRWLFNIEGDSKLFRARWNDFRGILAAIDFL